MERTGCHYDSPLIKSISDDWIGIFIVTLGSKATGLTDQDVAIRQSGGLSSVICRRLSSIQLYRKDGRYRHRRNNSSSSDNVVSHIFYRRCFWIVILAIILLLRRRKFNMVDLRVIIQNALKARVAIPAFNVPYLPMIEPVIRAVVDHNSFALIETARLEWLKFKAGSPKAVAKEFFRCQVPDHVRLHLDHVPVIDEDGQRVNYLEIIQRAISFGYHSVMVDGSRLPLDENIAAARQAADAAHKAGLPCEAELGAVLGHESGPLPPYDELFASGQGFTKVVEARRFVAGSGCDWLSVAIGNIHGAISDGYKDQKKVAARLDLDHLESLSKAVSIPLVLHGGSGISREYVLASFQKGIAKINIGTEIRQTYESSLQSTGEISSAQQAVYERTSWLIAEYFCLENIHSIVTQKLP
jgi:fructose-bisphosphate aldolase, class II